MLGHSRHSLDASLSPGMLARNDSANEFTSEIYNFADASTNRWGEWQESLANQLHLSPPLPTHAAIFALSKQQPNWLKMIGPQHQPCNATPAASVTVWRMRRRRGCPRCSRPHPAAASCRGTAAAARWTAQGAWPAGSSNQQPNRIRRLARLSATDGTDGNMSTQPD